MNGDPIDLPPSFWQVSYNKVGRLHKKKAFVRS